MDSATRKQRLAAVGEMAAGIAHEIRNPLASMSGSHGLGHTRMATESRVTTEHSHPSAGGVHTFMIHGQPVTDFGRVQQHITSLETAISEQSESNRRDFVAALAQRNVIPATQVDQMTAHALSLTDEQWATFQQMYPEDAAPAALFSNHGTNGSESNPTSDNGPSEVDTLRETVSMHRRSNMPEDKVKETKSYKRLMELTDGKG